MAFLDEDEIISQVRNEMRLEDEDGKCGAVLPSAHKRAKHGGLPLDFRCIHRDDDDEGQGSPGYSIPLDEEAATRDLLSSRLRSRTADSDQLKTELERRPVASDDEAMERRKVHFVEKSREEVEEEYQRKREKLKEKAAERQRALSELNGEKEEEEEDPELSLRRFASFEGEEGPSNGEAKEIMLIYAVGDETPRGEIPFNLSLRVRKDARVTDFIGLGCYKYFMATGKLLSCPPEHLMLYIAEESGEIDSDFPPLDPHKHIGEFGFTVLAVKENRRAAQSPSMTTVYVYLPDRTCFPFQLPHLQKTLEWLRDEVLKKREATMDESTRNTFTILHEYRLEHVDVPDVALDLSASISSTGTTEFVLVRKNSSRRLFHPRGALSPHDSVPPTPSTAAVQPSSSAFEFPSVVSRALPVSSPRPSSLVEDVGLIADFRVERLHKYKMKWTARLSLRWNCIEVVPWNTERRPSVMFAGGGQKSTLIAWEDIATVQTKEKKNPGGGVSLWQVSIVWLPPPGTSSTAPTPTLSMPPTTPVGRSPSINGFGADAGIREIASRYKEGDKWKTLSVEAESYSAADHIAKLLNDGIKQRNSAVSQVYGYSSKGSLRPAAAAEAALAYKKELATPLSPTFQPQHQRKRSSFMQFTGNISKILKNRDD